MITAGIRNRSARSTPGTLPDRWPDQGSASMLVLGVAAVLVFAGMATTAVASVAVTRHQVASAADMAALAAAGRAMDGPAVACRAAGSVAVPVGSTVTRCTVEGDEAQVTVRLRPPGWLGRFGSASSTARAGVVADASTQARTPLGGSR